MVCALWIYTVTNKIIHKVIHKFTQKFIKVGLGVYLASLIWAVIQIGLFWHKQKKKKGTWIFIMLQYTGENFSQISYHI